MNIPAHLSQELTIIDGSTLEMRSPMRYLPGKRLAGIWLWQGEEVFAKLFFGKDALKYAQRDYQGVQLLLAADIATPAIKWFGQVGDGLGLAGESLAYVLIMQKMDVAEDIETVMKSSVQPEKKRFALACDLVATLAQHHHANLLQTDLFLKNFLWAKAADLHKTGLQVYTLDGDGIEAFKQLPDKLALRNLSILLSKFDVMDVKQHLAEWLSIYTDQRAWKIAPNAAKMWRYSQKVRQKVATQYADKKVFRTCTDVFFNKKNLSKLNALSFFRNKLNVLPFNVNKLNVYLQTHFWLRREYFAYTDFINAERLDTALEIPAFKKGNTCTIGRLDLTNSIISNSEEGLNNSQVIVIKRYNLKNVFHAVARCMRKTRAAVSWANAHRLLLLGIPANLPVALLEERYFFGFFVGKSYFLTQYINAPDIADYFAQSQDKAHRADAVKQTVLLLHRLYLLHISHGDLKSTNIKMQNHAPILIDLDSMQQHHFAWFAKRQHARDLRRFMRNWQADVALTSAFKKSFKVIYQDHSVLKLANIIEN